MPSHDLDHAIHETCDVHEHAASLALWDQRYEQISGGRFEGRIEDLRIGPVQLFREQTSRAVVQQGLPRPGTLTLAIALASGGDDRICGRSLRPDGGYAVIADGEFELVTHGAFDVLALDIDRQALAAHASQVSGATVTGDDLQVQGPRGLHGHDPHQVELRTLLLDTLRTARESPGLLQHMAMRRALVQTACDALLARIRLPMPTQEAHATAASRERVVREARAWMRAHAHEPIDVPMLCDALGVSRRTLQYSFEAVLQLSPVTYLRALRLNGVRRELMRGSVEPVADCAARWGFWHLSRFAAEYRALFGEKPSETAARARTALH
ncbi:helix-turn-helix domain-containing protein [Leptothrix discophora]|uniref:Helix-turn-helix domain-containing protein n=1 Tax=Leptothrix discophora TaxID=89 RepID=A0ABT9G4H6_LEPDI|nr:helix-turn-helix domain-containing protein [Leptothrix discophora]MDP4301157.1 helix-turn-helix domain-containing protein [Leptothrix discophora]